MVRKAQAAAWEEKFMAMKAKQKESNKVSVVTSCFYTPTEAISVIFCGPGFFRLSSEHMLFTNIGQFVFWYFRDDCQKRFLFPPVVQIARFLLVLG